MESGRIAKGWMEMERLSVLPGRLSVQPGRPSCCEATRTLSILPARLPVQPERLSVLPRRVYVLPGSFSMLLGLCPTSILDHPAQAAPSQQPRPCTTATRCPNHSRPLALPPTLPIPIPHPCTPCPPSQMTIETATQGCS